MQAHPHVLADRRQRLQLQETTTLRDTTQQMNISVQQLYACSAELRQCGDIIEGSVLVLGVRTAHTLITQLTNAMNSIKAVVDAWHTTSEAQQEHIAMYRKLTASLDQAYTNVKDRREIVEKELRALRLERDRKEQAYDAAVLYVQRVIAEHTQWQQVNGHNCLNWPVMEACEEAMTALGTARAVPSTVGPDRRNRRDLEGVREDGQPTSSVRSLSVHEDVGSVSATVLRPPGAGASHLREWVPAVTSSNGAICEESSDVAQRWRSTVAARLGALQPSIHFCYVPPAEEVKLLREVLSMGTGSITLMKDVQVARTHLEGSRVQLRTACARNLSSVRAMRQELNTLRTHLRQMVEGGAPFSCTYKEFMSRIRTYVDEEVRRRLTSAAAAATDVISASSRNASMSHLSAATPTMHTATTTSLHPSVPAEDEASGGSAIKLEQLVGFLSI